MTVHGATVVVVGAGYPSKRRIYERIAALGASVVIVEEVGHWSERLVDDGVASRWLTVPVTGDPDEDTAAVLAALSAAEIRPDAVFTYWDTSVSVAARAAAALGLPGNPVEAVDSARSKVRERERSEQAGLPTPRSARVRSLDELYAAAAVIGFPSVVKPEFGAEAIGCLRVDSAESFPDIYPAVRKELEGREDLDLRAGNDLILEEYLDGVEFDIDVVLEDGKCVFSSVSQNWPTAEPAFLEAGLHCPPDHNSVEVGRLVDLTVRTVQALGFERGVLHVEGKCTSKGPRIVEVNARLGGGRIDQVVEAVWGVDLIEAHLRSALGLPQQLAPSRKPRCVVVAAVVYPPSTGRLAALPFTEVESESDPGLFIDIEARVGEDVDGPDRVFPTRLAEVYLGARNLRRARSLLAQVLRDPPVVVPAGLAAKPPGPRLPPAAHAAKIER